MPKSKQRPVLVVVVVAVVAMTITWLLRDDGLERSQEHAASSGSDAAAAAAVSSGSPEVPAGRTAIPPERAEPPDRADGIDPERTEELPPVQHLVVCARDPRGNALVDALIRGFDAPTSEIPAPDGVDPVAYCDEAEKWSATTGAEGTASLDLPVGRHLLVVKARGFAAATRWLEVPCTSPVDIAVGAPAGFHGEVVHSITRQAIADARLVALPRKSRGTETDEERLDRMVLGANRRSGPDGKFEFTEMPETRLLLLCDVVGFPQLNTTLDPLGQEVVLEVAGELAANGIVVDENGAPVEGATVKCCPRGILPSYTASEVRSGPDGTFRLEKLPAGDVAFISIDRRFATTKVLRTLTPGEEPFVELCVGPRAPVSGKVVDDLGRPVSGAFVQFFDKNQNLEPCIVHTEADGSFETLFLHPASIIDMSIEKEGYAYRGFFGIPLDERPQTFVLPLLGAIRGRVVGADGDPVRRFSIRAFVANAPRVLDRHRRMNDAGVKFESEDGSFELRGTNPAPYELNVEAEGFIPAVVRVDETPRGGSTVGPILVEVKPGQVVRGRVVDQDGRARAGVPIAFPIRSLTGEFVDPDSADGVRTDAVGEFELGGVPEGTFDLLVGSYDLGHRIYRDLVAEEFPRDLVLAMSGGIAGRVITLWRSPATASFVRVNLLGEWLGMSHDVDADGRFSCRGLSPGEYEVTLVDDWGTLEYGGDCITSTTVEVRSGETTEVVLELSARGRVVGRVVRPSGLAASNQLQVTIERADDRRAVAATTVEPDGRFLLGGLPLGDYVALVRSVGTGVLLRAEQAFAIESIERAAVVEVRLPESGVVGVVDGLGEAGRAEIAFANERTGALVARVRSGRGGGYRAFVEEAGRYIVLASAPGFADDWSVRAAVPVPPDAETLHHRLAPEAPLEIVVVDDRDVPIADAEVRVDLALRPAVLPRIGGRTDGRGGLRLRRLPAGRALASVKKSGHVAVRERPVHLDAGAFRRETIRMMRSSSLLVSADASSLRTTGSIEVELHAAAAAGFESRAASVTSDAPARFSDLVPGRYRLESTIGAPIEVDLKAGETERVALAAR